MAESCLHIANVVYLLSYLVRDMLHLRVLTCVGLGLGVVFFACRPSPLYGATIWHVVFLVINSVQIRRLVRERRRLMLTEEQERVGEATFHDLSREELLALLTRVTCEKPEGLQDLALICKTPLNPDEVVLRDIAFGRLSRKELLNLLTRRLWNSIARRNLARRKGRSRPAPVVAERDVARRPAVG